MIVKGIINISTIRERTNEGAITLDVDYFSLTDWLVAATMANTFCDDYIATSKREKEGVNTANELEELYNTFKTFDISFFDENISPYFKAFDAKWIVPKEVKEFILEVDSR